MAERRVTDSQSGFGLVRTRSAPLASSTHELLRQAWAVRERHHPPVLTVAKPHRTLAVSVTGAHCGLDCRHCGGHYLQAMTPVEGALAAYGKNEFDSCLISGGCNAEGSVPVWDHEDTLLKLKARNARLNCHVGACDRHHAVRLRGLVDCVSFDLVGDNATLREVYGVDYGIDKLWESFRVLSAMLPTYPHICIGLRGGRISGEYAVLQKLRGMTLPAVVFLVLKPTPDTPYAECAPPSPDDVARVLAYARLELPQTPLYLGCMRPGGRYRAIIDQLAVRAGVQKIVKPMPATLPLAQKAGLTIRTQEECCVL